MMSKESFSWRMCFKEDAMFLVWMFRMWFVSDVVCWFSFACVMKSVVFIFDDGSSFMVKLL